MSEVVFSRYEKLGNKEDLDSFAPAHGGLLFATKLILNLQF